MHILMDTPPPHPHPPTHAHTDKHTHKYIHPYGTGVMDSTFWFCLEGITYITYIKELTFKKTNIVFTRNIENEEKSPN